MSNITIWLNVIPADGILMKRNLWWKIYTSLHFILFKPKNTRKKNITWKGCAPGCATVTDNGELVIATGESLKYYNVMEKNQVNYPVPGEKFKIIAHGKYICVMLKDHNLNSENVYKISVFNPKEKLNIFTAQYDHVKSIALQVMKFLLSAEILSLDLRFFSEFVLKLIRNT